MKSTESTVNLNRDEEIKSALRDVAVKYGIDTAKVVEQMYRIETNHFKSKQFQNTFSAGMEKHRENFPFGWFSMANLWNSKPEFAPVGFYEIREGKGLSGDGGKVKTFVKFANVKSGMFALAEYLKTHRPGRWYAGDNIAKSEAYERALTKITNRFV